MTLRPFFNRPRVIKLSANPVTIMEEKSEDPEDELEMGKLIPGPLRYPIEPTIHAIVVPTFIEGKGLTMIGLPFDSREAPKIGVTTEVPARLFKLPAKDVTICCFLGKEILSTNYLRLNVLRNEAVGGGSCLTVSIQADSQ